MGQCCSAKSKNPRKYRDNSKNSDFKENILLDRVVMDQYKDFIVYQIKPSSGYTFLQKQILLQAKDNNAREYQFLKVESDSKSISLAQPIKPFTSSEAEDKMLKILFDFKEIIIHNNQYQPFDSMDATHPINKLISNFRLKNVKPKAIHILADNSISFKFNFISDEAVCQNFTTPVLVVDCEDITYQQKIVAKETWHGSNLYVHSRKSYESNIGKYEEYLQIQQFFHLYKNPAAAGGDNPNSPSKYYEINTADKKKQQKAITQLSESIAKCFQQGINTLIIHENTDKKSISYLLILIQSMLQNRLHIEEQYIMSYWERRLPKGIYDSFRQEQAEQKEAEKQKQQEDLEPLKEEKKNNNIQIKEINLSDLSISAKIEILMEKLFIEQKYELPIFEKAQNLLEKLLTNITSQFEKKEYRSLNLSNQNLQCLFKYQYGMKLLKEIGFIESAENNGFLNNPIDDIAYFKSLKSDYTIASKNFSQSQLFIEQSKNYQKRIQKDQKTS